MSTLLEQALEKVATLPPDDQAAIRRMEQEAIE
jgi:hypothetical protein